ncbi:cAMP-binding proteins - catabolite gene activator and regulatory subunit of cAMP-dependent protein kinases [Rhodovastum atsumiense]|uniref:Cyclic nucleotide-binding domain-containing protein n=1 Tax=Rhodovastum atsumiense TaxID=504468 RepID=A0A5M6IZB4_9PROT|nr:cyclic nucleotide-binding domain-containing protein [Rhodovastum atsumiense]KAA5613299.1 cyclic nucleotide-binding domain-containing protein [Rhodovastum atsumiense]CAH2600528.1 cAMP-binding proteins - catabolite gene activator and regulatory subunit of cAMP-dependent protein kinases [Rhodovastum atsumiense]
MEMLDQILLAQPFFSGLSPRIAALIASCARNHVFHAGDYLFHEGTEARTFYLIREGEVALEIDPPGHLTMVLNTLHEGDIVGASWLVPPYRWNSDARAATRVRALGFDAICLRRKCEADPDVGYALMKRFVPLLVSRLQAAHLQLLDVYSPHRV